MTEVTTLRDKLKLRKKMAAALNKSLVPADAADHDSGITKLVAGVAEGYARSEQRAMLSDLLKELAPVTEDWVEPAEELIRSKLAELNQIEGDRGK